MRPHNVSGYGTARRYLLVVLVLLTIPVAPALEADLILGAGPGALQPASATGEAEAETESSAQPCLTLIITWVPVLALGVVWIWFMRHYAKTMRRSRQHMDDLERLTKQIVEALGRIEQALDRK